MDDLAARLTERLRRRDEKIAALEARIAKADALAEAVGTQAKKTASAVSPETRAALAVYREGSDT